MAFPILQGIQLFNAARGLLHDIRGIRPAARAESAIPPNSPAFANILNAQLKLASTPAMTGVTPAPKTTATGPFADRIGQLIGQYEESLAAIREQLGSFFSDFMVDDFQEIDLGFDGDGNVVVANDHPDADRIEALFAAHPILRLAFQRLSVNASMIETGLDLFPVPLRFPGQPQTAVNQYATLLSGTNSPSQFHLVIGSDGISTYFGDSGSGDTTEGATEIQTAT
jgi:hypothetical protein